MKAELLKMQARPSRRAPDFIRCRHPVASYPEYRVLAFRSSTARRQGAIPPPDTCPRL